MTEKKLCVEVPQKIAERISNGELIDESLELNLVGVPSETYEFYNCISEATIDILFPSTFVYYDLADLFRMVKDVISKHGRLISVQLTTDEKGRLVLLVGVIKNNVIGLVFNGNCVYLKNY